MKKSFFAVLVGGLVILILASIATEPNNMRFLREIEIFHEKIADKLETVMFYELIVKNFLPDDAPDKQIMLSDLSKARVILLGTSNRLEERVDKYRKGAITREEFEKDRELDSLSKQFESLREKARLFCETREKK